MYLTETLAPKANCGCKGTRYPFRISGVTGRIAFCQVSVSVPAGLLVHCSWEGLKPSMGPFQNLWGCRQEYQPLGLWPSQPFIDWGSEIATVKYRDLSGSPGAQEELSLVYANRTLHWLWLGWAGAPLQGLYRIYSPTKFGLSPGAPGRQPSGLELVHKLFQLPHPGLSSVWLLPNTGLVYLLPGLLKYGVGDRHKAKWAVTEFLGVWSYFGICN